MPQSPTPRDLWARTSAALDRELAYSGRQQAGRGSRAGATASVAASLAVFGAAALVVMSQWPLLDRPVPTLLRATPFAVPDKAVAYLGTGPQGLSIFRTSIDRVCPIAAADCVGEPPAASSLALSRPFEASTLSLSPSGRQLAITGRDGDREGIIAIVTMPDVADSPTFTSTTPAVTSPVVAASASPGITVPPRPGATTEPILETPAAGLAVVPILEDALGVGSPPAWSSDGQMLAFSAMPADGTAGPDLYVWQPGDGTARRLSDDQSTYFASWSGARIVVSRLVEPAADEPIAVTVVIDPASGEERIVEEEAMWLPQLNGPATHAVAWQGTLTWRGHAATADLGALYLLDWATIDPWAELEMPPATKEPDATPDGLEPAGPEPIDPIVPDSPQPEPGETAGVPRAAPTFMLTLPPIIDEDAEASPAPALEPDETEPAPEPTNDPSVDPTDEPSADPSPDPSADPSPDPSAEPSPDPDASLDPSLDPSAEPSPDPDASLDPSLDPSAEPSPDPDASPAPSAWLHPIEPGRDPLRQPVRDWEVRWSPDGALVGYWIADVPGSSWGRLVVVPLDAQSGELALASPLLAPTLARRSFTINVDRIAWVAPVDHNPDGELRINAWGPDGFGMLRLRAPDIDGAVSPF
jgi:hypothetical protein